MNEWKEKKRPVCLEKRFEFETYEKTRDFLDRLGAFSEEIDRFPDISFGKTYVNITLRPESEDESIEISKQDHEFATQIDRLLL